MISYLDAKDENELLWNQGMKFLDTVEGTRKLGPWRIYICNRNTFT